MKSGNMFGRLRKYKESAYFNSHRIITFDTLYEDGQYAVFFSQGNGYHAGDRTLV